ncbi:MAG: YncE family protein [Mycobacterium sp.]
MKQRSDGSVLLATIPLGDRVSDIVTNPHNRIVYAALSDSVAVIGSPHEVSCVIPVGAGPRELAIDSAGSRLYAINHCDSVSVIDVWNHRVSVIPGACCVQHVETADGAMVYAAGNDAHGGRISVIGEGGETVASIDGFDGYTITGLAADSKRRRLYAGLSGRTDHHQYDDGLLDVIDTATNSSIDTIELVGPPDTITIGQGGSTMYATHYDHRCVSAVDLASLRVTRISLADNPVAVTLTPDGLQAYVTNRTSLSVIDTVANEAAPIAVGDLPRCARISPDGKYAYVSNFGDRSVSVIDTITRCPIETIDTAGPPEALALSPDGHRLYVGDYWSGTVTVLSVQP